MNCRNCDEFLSVGVYCDDECRMDFKDKNRPMDKKDEIIRAQGRMVQAYQERWEKLHDLVNDNVRALMHRVENNVPLTYRRSNAK